VRFLEVLLASIVFSTFWFSEADGQALGQSLTAVFKLEPRYPAIFGCGGITSGFGSMTDLDACALQSVNTVASPSRLKVMLYASRQICPLTIDL